MASSRLRKDDDDDQPRAPPLPPSGETASQSQLKLRKSNLHGAVTWDDVLAKLELNTKYEYATCVETMQKMLSNVVSNPHEPK